MNPERLLQLFETITEAENAVPRLRRFILDLAVRGKLVKQNAEEGPASSLLTQIQKEKARLEGLGILRNQTSHSLDMSQRPFAIPTNWCWSQLAEIGIVNPRIEAKDSIKASFIPMPMIFAEYGKQNRHEVRLWGDIRKGFTQFAEGDVGLAKITPCFENGKSTVFKNLEGGIGAGTTELHIVRPILVLADYVLIFLKSPHFIEAGIAKMTGSAGQKRVPKDYFSFSAFPLPPLAEQHRIVAKVGELMALCDELEAARAKREARRDRLVAATLHRLNNGDTGPEFRKSTDLRETASFYFNQLPRLTARPEHIKQLRQTVLNLAVLGKLAAQSKNDQPAASALRQLELEGGNKKVRRGVPIGVEPPDFVKKERVPQGWAIQSIAHLLHVGAICDLKDGNHGANHPKVSEFTATGLPFITAAQVSDKGDIDYDGAYKVPDNVLARLRVGFAKPEDVIYTHKGSVGRVGICDRDCILTPQTTYYRLNDKILSNRYLRVFLLSTPFRRQVDGVKGQTTRDFVSIGAQYNFFIYIPPIAEQYRIVAKVDEIMALCDDLEAHLTTTATTRCQLVEATLREALLGYSASAEPARRAS